MKELMTYDMKSLMIKILELRAHSIIEMPKF